MDITVVCKVCHMELYNTPVPHALGNKVDPALFVPIGSVPKPQVGDAVICPNCHQVPFFVHNTGLQFLATDGEIYPQSITY
jgi:hypothetical protein